MLTSVGFCVSESSLKRTSGEARVRAPSSMRRCRSRRASWLSSLTDSLTWSEREGVVQHGLGLVVGEAGHRVDHRLAEAHVHDVGIVVHLPDHGEGQVVFFGAQGAQLGGQQAGQHVQATLHEVGGGRPMGRLLVQRGVGVHEVGDVSDMHPRLQVAVGQTHAVQRVVDVFAAGRVDAHHRDVA